MTMFLWGLHRCSRSAALGSIYGGGEIVSQREQWDEEWRELGRSRGWELPPPAAWPLRIWGIRYVRAAAASVQFIRKNRDLAALDCFPSDYDDWVIYAIARGWC